MIKWLCVIVLTLSLYLLFKSEDPCETYFPYRYQETDTTLMSSFILVNSAQYDTAQLQSVLDYVAGQMPVMIVTVENKYRRAFEYGEVLESSLIFCGKKVKKFRTAPYKRRLSIFPVDTASIPREVYINFLDGGFENIPVIPYSAYRNFSYTNRIVIVGDMGSSIDSPIYDSKDSMLQLPVIDGTTKYIYEVQLLSLIFHSIMHKDFLKELTLTSYLLSFIVVGLLFSVIIDVIIRTRMKLILKYFIVKLVQIVLILSVYLGLALFMINVRFVLDIEAFLLMLLVGGEILFWMLYVFFRRKSTSSI